MDFRDEDDETDGKQPPAAARPFYKSRKFWTVFAIVLALVIVVGVPVLLLVVFPKIAQNNINNSQIVIHSVLIRDETADSFLLTMRGGLANGGPIAASVDFGPTAVGWRADNGTVYALGTVQLPSVDIVGGAGVLETTANFSIGDRANFQAFTDYMLAAPSFDWNMQGTATVRALGRTVPNLQVNKDVTLTGFNNFAGVQMLQFALPANDPQGGITMTILASIPNNSPIGVELGTVGFNISYQGVFLGPVQAVNASLMPMSNNTIRLDGRIVEQPPENLAVLSTLFSDYLNGVTVNSTVTGGFVAPDGGTPNPWLTTGIRNVTLTVPFNNGAQASSIKYSDGDDVSTITQPVAPAPMNIIKGVNIGSFDLAFNPATPYSPLASSNDVFANYSVPFGFSMNITAVKQNMTMATADGVPIAQLLSTEFGNASSDQASGIMSFSIANSPLAVIPGQEFLFQLFTANLTLGESQTFLVTGNATVNVTLPIGPVVLSGIAFSAQSSLSGLQGLLNPGPVVQSLDVTGGSKDGLLLSINTSISNPSNLQISTDDVKFLLEYSETEVGTVTLPNMTLLRGNQTVTAQSLFVSGVGEGQSLLNSYLAGQNADAFILGYNGTDDTPGTTDITSLAIALPSLKLPATIPGLQSKLVVQAAVKILNSTIATSIADASVVVNNPFTADFAITAISSSVTSKGMNIGSINVDTSKSPITIKGHSQGQSGDLPFTMNLDPLTIATLLRNQALANGLDVAPLDALLALGHFHVNSKKRSFVKRGLFDNFNLSQFVQDAFKNFKVDVALNSTIQIGDYSTPMSYNQVDVPALTDSSITALIPVVGQPIVQAIVSASMISFSTILITNPTNSGFSVHMKGSITQTGPIDAAISFPNGIDIFWKNEKLGSIAMPPILAKANVGATIDMDATFSISDSGTLEAFSEVLLLESSFSWHLQSSSISVTALGFTFTGIQLEKDITLNGFDGFAPLDGQSSALTISNFSFYNPPEQAIGVKMSSVLSSRSSIGMSATINFEYFYQDNSVDLGSLTGTNMVINPNPAGSAYTNSTLYLDGFLDAQKTTEGQNTVAELFTRFLGDQSSILFAKGLSCSGPSGKVDWLSQAITKVVLKNIVFPGLAPGFKLIQSLSLDNVEMDFVEGSAYSPLFSSSSITSGFQLPFPIPMEITQIKQNLVLEALDPSGPISVATIIADYMNATTTSTGATTGVVNFAVPKSANVHLEVIPGKETVFNLFTLALTVGPSLKFQVNGTVDVVVATKIASFPLKSIPVDVQSQLAGLADLGGQAVVNSLSVDAGSSAGIVINLLTTITNPSNLTIDVGNATFDTSFTYNNETAKVGETSIQSLVLQPGPTQYHAVFLFNPAQDPVSQRVGEALLSGFLMGGSADIVIQGTASSTPVESLKIAFSQVRLKATVQGIPPTLIKQSDLYTSPSGILAKTANSSVALSNPFNTDIALNVVGLANVTYNIQNYSSCPYARNLSSWDAADFGALSGKTPGPSNIAVHPKSAVTSPLFLVDLNLQGMLDPRPVVFGLGCAKFISAQVNPDLSGVTNTLAYVDVQLSAKVSVGTSSDPYVANIVYQQNNAEIYNHFSFPYTSPTNITVTIYCVENFLTNLPCCRCALGKGPCPTTCPPLPDGTPVGGNSTSSSLPSSTSVQTIAKTSASIMSSATSTPAKPKSSVTSAIPSSSSS